MNTNHGTALAIDALLSAEKELTQLKADKAELLDAMTGMLDNYRELKSISLIVAKSDSPGWIGQRMTVDDDIHVQRVTGLIAKHSKV